MPTLPIHTRPAVPWHREPWPWLLMLGPAAVIVAGVITSVIAYRGADGLVAEDYYKQGLAINRLLAKERRAAEAGITGRMHVQRESGHIVVDIAGLAVPPASLGLRLVHPSRAGLDRNLLLRYAGAQRYIAAEGLPEGRWSASLEGSDWRISGVLDSRGEATLSGEPDAARR